MSGSVIRHDARSAMNWRVLATFLAAGLFVLSAARGDATSKQPTSIAIVDFDYRDTSGEPRDQKDEHETRLRNFMQSLRSDLEKSGAYKVAALDCRPEPCSVMRLTPEELFDATRKAGAQLLLFGAVHKMSTLVQWAQVQIIDVDKNVVIDDRHLSFRGDSDEAWRRAEAFIVKQLNEKTLPN